MVAVDGGVGAVGVTYRAVVGRVDGGAVETSGFGLGLNVDGSTVFPDDKSDHGFVRGDGRRTVYVFVCPITGQVTVAHDPPSETDRHARAAATQSLPPAR